MGSSGFLICIVIGTTWGVVEMLQARKNPRIVEVEPRDPNQTGNSRTRAGMFGVFGGK